MKRTILTASCAVAAAFWGGCNRSIPTLAVEALLANPQSHSHTMVRVKGCFVLEFEKSVLEPCKSQNQGQCIWIDDAMSNKPGFWGPTNRKDPAPIKLLFEYDEGRDKRAWKELTASLDQQQITSEVVLLGQFETIASHAPGEKTGFGHLGAYANELILLDVLGSKFNTTR